MLSPAHAQASAPATCPILIMLKRLMHNRERRYAIAEDNRSHGRSVGAPSSSADRRRLTILVSSLASSRNAKRSSTATSSFTDSSRPTRLSEPFRTKSLGRAGCTTPFAENNTVYGKYFPAENNKRAAVLVLPHWNAKAGTYFDLCKIFNRAGMSALRMTLPYHEESQRPGCRAGGQSRRPERRADAAVAAAVGGRFDGSAVAWLKSHGYERIGIVGTSIGSCVGFFAFVHDLESTSRYSITFPAIRRTSSGTA